LDTQRAGRLFGWLFIATFITGIGARVLFVNGLGATWENMRFIPGATSEASMYLGAILEFGVIITNIGTAVVLYPLVRRKNETLALGYVTARIVECTFILVGLVSIVSTVSVSNALVGASSAQTTPLAAQGSLLVSTYEWAFLFGPGLVVGFGNGLILGYLIYRSGLVPRRMAMFGLVGGPMLILSFGLILFGVYENGSGLAFLLALPEIIWEASLGVYAAWKGFRRSHPAAVDVFERALEPTMAGA
jgi:hypothetical protein